MDNEKEPTLQFYLFENKLFYKGKTCIVSENLLDEFTSKLSNFWWSEYDKIVLFTYYDDKTFSCEKQKTVYDHKLKKSVPVLYNFYEATETQIRELFNAFSELYETCRLEVLKTTKEQIKQKLQEEFNLIVTNLRGLRSIFLSKSDWTQIPDVPISDKMRELWKKYRQILRDVTNNPNWTSNNILKVDFPIDPENYLLRYPNEEVEYLSTPDQYENHAVISTKMKLLKFVGYIGLPSLLEDREVTKLSYEELKNRIDKALNKIDPSLDLNIVYREASSGACADSGTNLQSGLTPEAREVLQELIDSTDTEKPYSNALD
jgi:hypothetical protein